jgi:hypothetical protein
VQLRLAGYTLRGSENNECSGVTKEKAQMKQVIRIAVAVFGFSLVALATVKAQVPYNEGPVERVVLLKIVPGHFDAFMADMKTNVEPIWKAEKAAGLIQDYQIFLNTTSSSPEDWDLGFSIVMKNMAALDGLADKLYDVRMKQYGSRDAEQKVIDKRVENAHVVSSMLLRDITLR